MLCRTPGLVVNTCFASTGSAMSTESPNTGILTVTARPYLRVSHSTVRRRLVTNASASSGRGIRGDGGNTGSGATDSGATGSPATDAPRVDASLIWEPPGRPTAW